MNEMIDILFNVKSKQKGQLCQLRRGKLAQTANDGQRDA